MPETKRCPVLPDAARLFSKYAFYFSVCVFLYAELFPFRFDFSWQQLSPAWSHAVLTPFWNPKAGIHVAWDDLANVLLTMPFGFAGLLHFGGRRRIASFCRWGVLGFVLGMAAELVQLSIPLRASVITDAINNGLGAFLGAATASLVGERALKFFTGTATERRNIHLWMLIWVLVAIMGPYDLGPHSLSRINSNLRALHTYPWGSGPMMGKDLVRMACFALIGAMAIRVAVPGRRRATPKRPLAAAMLVLFLPVILECARLLVESDGPSLSDLALDIFAALAGAYASLFVPQISLAFSGFLLFNVTLIVAGLSPFRFSGWQAGASFQWIPFYEFCTNRTSSSFYDLTLTFFSAAILGGLLRQSFPRCKGRHVVVYALVFSGAIEFAHLLLPDHTADTTGILVAGLGAWTGAYFCSAIESARSGCQTGSLKPHPDRLS